MSNFNFEKEMVYGKKHLSILNYNNEQYDFRPFLKHCFNTLELNNIHNIHNIHQCGIIDSFGKDVDTWYHRKFYNYIKSNTEIKILYEKLITDVILPYLNINEALVQQFPSIRFHLPNNIAIAKKHTDNSLGHPIGEINFTYSFTDMYDSNTLLVEKMPRLEEYEKIVMKSNNICSFNGNLCNHYNILNETNNTRISMDFRVLPLNYFKNDNINCSISTNKKFIDGDYYKLFKNNNINNINE